MDAEVEGSIAMWLLSPTMDSGVEMVIVIEERVSGSDSISDSSCTSMMGSFCWDVYAGGGMAGLP